MLKGLRLHLRTLEPGDADYILKVENNPKNWRVSHTLVPFSKKMIEDYVNSAQDLFTHKQIRFLICLQNETPVGTVDLFELDSFHQRVGVGILIEGDENRRKGYASEALEIIKEYCFDHLFLKQIYCNILESNKESIALFNKVGFKLCGTKENWHKTGEGWENELMFQLLN